MTITCIIRTEKTAAAKAHPLDLCVGDAGKHQQKLGLTYSEAVALRNNLSTAIAVYTDVIRAERAHPAPAKNTDPKKLDKTNEGDAAVLTLETGTTISCTITDVCPEQVCVEWRTGPGSEDWRYRWLRRSLWERLTLFPAGCKFLAV